MPDQSPGHLPARGERTPEGVVGSERRSTAAGFGEGGPPVVHAWRDRSPLTTGGDSRGNGSPQSERRASRDRDGTATDAEALPAVTEFKLLRDPTSASVPGAVGLLLEASILSPEGHDDDGEQDGLSLSRRHAERIEGVALGLWRAGGNGSSFSLIAEADADPDTATVTGRLLELSTALADVDDSLDAAAIREALEELGAGESFGGEVEEAMPDIGDAVAVLLLQKPVDLPRLADATRLWMVGVLVVEILVRDRKLTASEVHDFLAMPLFAPLDASSFPETDVELVRAAAVSDLFVVRREWRGYARGEIASLKNVMAGEGLRQSNTHVRETEQIEVTETQVTSSEESSEESRTSSEFSREVSSLLSASLEAQVGAEVTGAFPGGTYRVGANARGSISISVAERLAARTAQEAVTKATSRMDSTTRIERSGRERVMFEDAQRYRLENVGSTNRRGVYRWLERVERFQVFKIPDRLQLEFQLPNPAEFHKYRLEQAAKTAAQGAPPDWNVTLDAESEDPALRTIVDQSDADELGTLYRAPDVPPEPKQTISLVDSKTLEAKNVPADDQAPKVVSPVAAGELEIVIPDGYEATELKYFMSGAPARGRWARERGNNDNSKAGWDNADPHVFHSIVLEAFGGGESHYKSDWLDEDQGLSELLTTQGNNYNVSTGFGDAYARSSAPQSIKFVDPANGVDNPVRVRLKLGFRSVGASHMQVGVQVICRRTAERYANWRQQVFETLLSAWSAWDRSFRSSQATSSIFGTAPTGERSSGENREMIQQELKRQVISWLLEEVPFLGRPGMQPLPAPPAQQWREFDRDKAIADAPMVQFFEQAFDWPNMGWIFYPYYWAGKDDWIELSGHDAADPDYERFLRSGSARVLVPVRKTFDLAVLYWLVYKKPFLGKGLPLPRDPMFVSLAAEIRNLTEAPADGEPVERAWDTRSSTPFLWLEDDAGVPSNADAALGLTEATKPRHPVGID